MTGLSTDLSGLGAAIPQEISDRTAGDAAVAAAAANASNLTSGTVSAARLPGDVVYNDQANIYSAGKQTLAASTNAGASLNVPAGAAPTAGVSGDLFSVSGADSHLQFVDQTNNVQELAFLTDVSNATLTAGTGISIVGNAINNLATRRRWITARS